MHSSRRLVNAHLKGVYLGRLLNVPANKQTNFALTACFASQASSAIGADSQGHERSPWRWLMFAPSIVAAYLGYWQVDRYQWKVDLLESRKRGLEADPIPMSHLPNKPQVDTKIFGEGRFLHDKSVYVGPRPKTINANPTAGFALITPFIVDHFSNPILVNRGWVPADWKSNPELRKSNSPEDKVALEGYVRVSEPRSSFVPDNQPNKDTWYWVDVPAIASHCGLPPETPLIEMYSDEVEPETRGNIPTSMDVLALKGKFNQPKTMFPMRKPFSELLNVSVKPVDHRNYALIWFSLSASTAFLAFKAIRKPGSSLRRVPLKERT